ncbi:MAG: hypothetical protein ACRD36_07740, partial [Candidatus Acidiferrum sp.]
GKESSMIELDQKQLRELGDAEPLAIDPQASHTNVLVRREIYNRLKALLKLDDYGPDEGASEINSVMAVDDASDPLLASYEQ